MDKTFVLDTSALIAFVQDEPGAGRIERLLKDTARSGQWSICLSFITIAELYYITWQEEGESAAKELIVLIKDLPVSIVESSERLTLLAGRIKATNKLSLADAFIVATAYLTSGILIHKDPEIERRNGFIATEKLPFKPSKKRIR